LFDVMLAGVVILIAGAGYFLVRRLDAAAPLLVERPILGIVVYAFACVMILGLLLRWGHQHVRVARALGPAGPLALLSAGMPAIGGILIIGSLGDIGPWLRDLGAGGLILYAGAIALLAGASLLPTYAQAILGGWAFGFAAGFPAALIGITLGALLGYAIGRAASGERIIRLIDEKPKWHAVRDALAGGGFLKTLGLVTLLRLPPNSPFAITNLVMSSVRIAILPYTLGTIIGLAPRTGVAVYAASQIQGALSDETPSKPGWMIGASIGLTILIVLIIGNIANHAIDRVTRAQDDQAPAD
jgi:uncharacterized membrane protein YdjX (TVP38/TMEM64 family)